MSESDNVVQLKTKLVKDPRELNVFKRAYQLAVAVHKASLTFPKIEQYALADQLRRSSKSICANIAEGFGKQNYSSAEFARFLGVAEGSAIEVQIWLQFAIDLEYIAQDMWLKWNDDCLAIKSMLHNLRKTL